MVWTVNNPAEMMEVSMRAHPRSVFRGTEACVIRPFGGVLTPS